MEEKYQDTRIIIEKSVRCKDCKGLGSINTKDYFDGAYEYDCSGCKGQGLKIKTRRITLEQLAIMIREVLDGPSKEKNSSAA